MRDDVKAIVRLLLGQFPTATVAAKRPDNEWEIWRDGKLVWSGPREKMPVLD